ncbi:hypothetical protein TWF696_001154 [Orbilia brochopaga]|uniref:RING zinc finger-like domain-containing protein n=1 Tax=Orbilia brochopaga TaxID=3140254 RepID=A0AAV9VFW4_9PEZI
MMSRTTPAEPHVAGGPVDPDGEVVCPLIRPDGRRCLKKCTGERRYRSMQEHIRRAHPDDYVPRLSATKDSFERMIRGAALHPGASGGLSQLPNGSMAGGPPSPSRGRNLNPGGGEERAKSSGWRYEDAFEPRAEDLTPPSTNSDADLSSTNTSLNSMSRSITAYSSFGSDVSQPLPKPLQTTQPRKRKNNSSIDNTRRHHTFHPSSVSTMQGLEPLHIPHAPSRQRKRLPQMMTSPHLSRQNTPMSYEPSSATGNESDPDRTLEHDDIARPASSTVSGDDEARTRWDELVFVASQAPEFLNQPPPPAFGFTGNTLTKSRSMADLEQRVRTTNITPPMSDRRDTPPDSGTFEKMQIPNFSRSVSPRASTGMLGGSNKMDTEFPNGSPLGNLNSLSSLNALNRAGGMYTPQITITYTPKVECSGCGLLTAMGEAMACSECIAGLCRSCVRKGSDGYTDGDEAHGTCPSCGGLDAKFKAVRMRIR